MKIEKLIERIRNNEINDSDKILVYNDYGKIHFVYDKSKDNIVLENSEDKLTCIFSLTELIELNYEVVDKDDRIFSNHLTLIGVNKSRDKYFANFNLADTLAIVNEDNLFIGYWEEQDMGYDFKFIGNRFIDYDNNSLCKLIREGQDILDNEFLCKIYREDE